MPDLLADTSAPTCVTYSVGQHVRIGRGPLQGFAGSIAEIDGDEVLVDLRDTISGLLIRCAASHVVKRS